MSDVTADWMEGEGLEAADPAEVERETSAEKLQRERLCALLPGAVEQLRRRLTGKENPIQLPNWPRLAGGLGGGLWPGCHILTGGTGTGKSQLALQLAYQAAKAGIPTRYVALELDSLGLVARLLCMAAGNRAGVWWSQLYNGQGVLSEQRLNELVRAYGAELAALPLYLATDQGPHGWSYDAIEPAVKELRDTHPEAEGKPVLLVVDFLQLLTSPRNSKREELRETIGRASYAARHAAREHGAAVLMLSSTPRDKYATMKVDLDLDGKPKTSAYDLVGAGKESGDIEYAADTAMVLTRGETPGEVWLAIAKQRAGRGGWFRLVEQNGWLMEGEATGAPGTKAQTDAEKRAETARKRAETAAAKKAAAGASGRDKAGGDDDR